jgi:hypothetical protein
MKHTSSLKKTFPDARKHAESRPILATNSRDFYIHMGLNTDSTGPSPKGNNSQHCLTDQCQKEFNNPIKAMSLADFASQLANC